MNKIIYVLIILAVLLGLFLTLLNKSNSDLEVEEACTMEAKICPDGSTVGRSGPNCEFVCPATPKIPEDVQALIDSKSDMIKVSSPEPMETIISPILLKGVAVGPWFFEASAPVLLTDWDGKIIAEGYVTAEGEWMTMNFVSFSGTLDFISPYKEGDPDFMKRGALIFKKDNPSDLRENDDALEIPVLFH